MTCSKKLFENKPPLSHSLYSKNRSNNELHKIPVLSPDLPDLAKLPGIRNRSPPGGYAPQPPEYYLSSKSNIHFVMSWNPTTTAFLHVGKNNPVNPVDLVYSGGMKTFIE